MKILKSYFVLLMITLLTPLLSGCWDRREINDVALVLASAIDKEKEGVYRASMQISLPSQLGGGSGGGGGTAGGESFYIDSETGKITTDARKKLETRMSRYLLASHSRVHVVGEDLAREDIRPLFDYTARSPEHRLTTYLIIAKGKGYDLLNASPKMERFSSESVREIAKPLKMNLKAISIALSAFGSDAIIPYMGIVPSQKNKTPSKEITLLGFAVFSEGKMTGILKDETAQGYNWLTNRRYTTQLIKLKEKNQYIEVQSTGGQVKMTARMKDIKHPHIDIEIINAISILENQSPMNLTALSNINELETKVEQTIKKQAIMTLNELKKDQSDVLSIGLLIQRQHPKEWKKIKKQWNELFANCTYSVKVKATVTKMGLITENIADKEPLP